MSLIENSTYIVDSFSGDYQDVMDWANVAEIDSEDFLRKSFDISPIKIRAPVSAAAAEEPQKSTIDNLSDLLVGYLDEDTSSLPFSSKLAGVASTEPAASGCEGEDLGIFE